MESSSSTQLHRSSTSSVQQQGQSSGPSASHTSGPEEGTVEGTNDQGTTKIGPAVSMSHPNAAMLQSQHVRQGSNAQPQSGKSEGEMEGTNDAGSGDIKPAASMSHPNAALLQSTGSEQGKGQGKGRPQPTTPASSGHEADGSSRGGNSSGASPEGAPEGLSNQGSVSNGPASSMSHPNAALLQSQQVKRSDTSAADMQSTLADTSRPSTEGHEAVPQVQSHQLRRVDTSAAGQQAAASSGYDPPPRVQELIIRLKAFMQQHIYPSEHIFEAHAKDPATKWLISPLNEQLKSKAKAAGLWNLWLPADLKTKLAHLAAHGPGTESTLLLGPGLSNLVSALHGLMLNIQVTCTKSSSWQHPAGKLHVQQSGGTRDVTQDPKKECIVGSQHDVSG